MQPVRGNHTPYQQVCAVASGFAGERVNIRCAAKHLSRESPRDSNRTWSRIRLRGTKSAEQRQSRRLTEAIRVALRAVSPSTRSASSRRVRLAGKRAEQESQPSKTVHRARSQAASVEAAQALPPPF